MLATFLFSSTSQLDKFLKFVVEESVLFIDSDIQPVEL